MPQTFQETNPPAGQRAAVGLTRIATALRHNAWNRGQAQQLTPTQAAVLTLLHRQAPLTPSAVAEHLAVGRPTVSDAVATLVDKRLVQKHSNPDDGRSALLDLTIAGRRAADDAALWPDFLAEAIEELAEDEHATLVRTLQKVIRGLQLRGQIPTSRMCTTCTYFRPYAHRGLRQAHHCAYVDLAFGDADLRFDCDDHDSAPAAQAEVTWQRFANARI